MRNIPEIIRLKSVQSTNNALAEMIVDNVLKNFTTIVTDNQVGGKGQGAHLWVSEPGMNLTFSMHINVSGLDPLALFVINKSVAISIVEFIRNIEPELHPFIKWPNDIIIDDRKIAGILIENIFMKDNIHCIAGIGININQKQFPEMERLPISLAILKGKTYDLKKLIISVTQSLVDNINLVFQGRADEIHSAYDDLLWKKNILTSCIVHNNPVRGSILGVDTSGRLLFRPEHEKEIMCLEHGEIKIG